MEGNVVGAGIGISAGIYKGAVGKIVVTATPFLNVSWEVIHETAILAFIGGIIGWIGAELMRTLKRWYIRWKEHSGHHAHG